MKRPHESEEEEEVEEEELVVDENGRVVGSSDVGLDFSFHSMMAPLNGGIGRLDAIRRQCDLVYGREDSFWLPIHGHNYEPRVLLEVLARDIFNHHTRNVDWSKVERESSGAEWWVQKRQASISSKASTSSSPSIGFHFDKDEDLVDTSDICLCPQISTVTYLSSAGAPTIICEKAAPLDYSDDQALYDSQGSGFKRVVISHPLIRVEGSSVTLKTISFDGRFLHGAPAELGGKEGEETRYTFLVNIWIGHRPQGLELLSDDLVHSINEPEKEIKVDKSSIIQMASKAACRRQELKASISVPRFESFFGPSGSEHKVSFGLHPLLLSASMTSSRSTRHCTIILDLNEKGTEGKISPGRQANDSGQDEMVLDAVPSFDIRCETNMAKAWQAVSLLYKQYQLVLIKGGALSRHSTLSSSFGFQELRGVYLADPQSVEKTWCIEQKGKDASDKDLAPSGVLGKEGGEKLLGSNPWYCSFVLNKGKGLDKALSLLPRSTPSLLPSDVRHAQSLWIFFGINSTKEELRGRSEHTDIITTSGTWHMQASGAKTWIVRPNLKGIWPSMNARAGKGAIPSLSGMERLRVDVEEGDLLMINTHLWWHATEIPPMTLKGSKGLSLSYARDFSFPSAVVGEGEEEEEEEGEEEVDHDNVDDVWASSDIPSGTVIARGEEANELADKARCGDEGSNCKLEIKGRKKEAVVIAIRDIAAGESLRVERSS